jgi:hypothetical protein
MTGMERNVAGICGNSSASSAARVGYHPVNLLKVARTGRSAADRVT